MSTAPFPKAVERFPRLRQSWLSVFDNCALSSRFATEYGEGWSSHPAARGIIVHRALARCLQLMMANNEGQVPPDVALELLEEVVRQADAEGVKETVTLPLREQAEARVTVRTWALYTSWPVEDFAAVEERFDTTLSYPDGQGGMFDRTVTGKLDLLIIPAPGTHAIVYDWKDTWGIPSEKLSKIETDESGFPVANVSEEGYFQQRFYALLAFRRYPRVQRVTLREFYPRYASRKARDRKGKLINPEREATITREQLPDIVAEMSALVERFDRAYETGKFRPAPGSHCTYCMRPEGCTIFPSARVEGRISSQAEAERLAGRLNVLDGLKRQTTKALRAWSNAHGSIHVRDAKRPRVYGPVVRLEKVKPDAEAVQRAIAAGRDPAELYESREVVEFCVHSPEEVHPAAAAARAEEEALLAMERAAENRRQVMS